MYIYIYIYIHIYIDIFKQPNNVDNIMHEQPTQSILLTLVGKFAKFK